jgi:DNA-binding response OmpR family regulator
VQGPDEPSAAGSGTVQREGFTSLENDVDMDCSVLVVDDDQEIRDAVAALLHGEGYRVRTAANGKEALAELDVEAPALVVLDMRMPVLDGLAFAQAAGPKRDGMKILVMTAAVDASLAARAVDADAYLAKPFDLEDLLAEVQRLC